MSNSPPVKNGFHDVPPPSNDPPTPSNVPIPPNSIQTPPPLNITVPKMKDINPPSKEWQRIQLPTDVLVLTVKDEEFLAVYAYLGNNVFKSRHDNLGRVYFGEMGDDEEKKVKISLLRCTEGSTEVGGSQNVVRNGVSVLQPKAVICVGFCGGLNPQKTKLGDVVISLKLSTYAHKKVSASKRPERRGVTANVSRNMGNLIKCAADGWNAPLENPEALDVTVHRDKEILSGPELCNDDTRRTELLDENPNAIAIEMEGEGVYAAAFDLQIEWAIIKGISDYADGRKSDTKVWQSFASVMAASVVHNMLKEPGVLANWPHYRGTEDRNPNGVPILRPHTKSNEDLLQMALQNLMGDSGQIQYKGRTLEYRAHGRIHSFREPWVYDGVAWDIETNVSVKKKHFKESEDAIKEAVKELIKKLETEGIIKI